MVSFRYGGLDGVDISRGKEMKPKVLRGHPERIEVLHEMGFKGPILFEVTPGESISFFSNNCDMCDKPWTVKCHTSREQLDEKITFRICDEHLRHARDKWPNKVSIEYRRILVE